MGTITNSVNKYKVDVDNMAYHVADVRASPLITETPTGGNVDDGSDSELEIFANFSSKENVNSGNRTTITNEAATVVTNTDLRRNGNKDVTKENVTRQNPCRTKRVPKKLDSFIL